jgi:hypothetical protein
MSTRKENGGLFSSHRENSSSKLNQILSPNGSNPIANGLNAVGSSNINADNNTSGDSYPYNPDFKEISVTIRKSERGFGFDIRDGILITKVTKGNHFNSKIFRF